MTTKACLEELIRTLNLPKWKKTELINTLYRSQ